MSSAPLYCTNHPKTETLLRCNRCGKPYCIRCLERTPVGYRCKECLSAQQAGYYTATPIDFGIAAVVGAIASTVGGGIATFLGGGIFFLLAIFYAPFVGGIIAQVIQWSVQNRRGRYLWIAACGGVIVGGLVGAGFLPLIVVLFDRGGGDLLGFIALLPVIAFRAVFNLGFLIYIVLAVGTVYARLRA
ncbi:MAG: hypothetical protein M1482_14015 [Chloroflexi bacterium]|nr:hypothetical protein [Chloroflexota bacterium]